MSISFFIIIPTPNDIYTLSLHDALPIYGMRPSSVDTSDPACTKRKMLSMNNNTSWPCTSRKYSAIDVLLRSEEHTSELQSHSDLVCRLLLEKKKKNKTNNDKIIYIKIIE